MEESEPVSNEMPEGFTDPPAAPGGPTVGSKMEKVKEFFSHRPDWYWEHYPMETLFVILFIVSFLYHQQQKAVNQEIASNCARIIVPIFNNYFKWVGCDNDQKSLSLIQRSHHDFYYFASGRDCIKYVDLRIELIHRNCILTRFSVDMYRGI